MKGGKPKKKRGLKLDDATAPSEGAPLLRRAPTSLAETMPEDNELQSAEEDFEAVLEQSFKMCDTNGNGRVSAEEVSATFRRSPRLLQAWGFSSDAESVDKALEQVFVKGGNEELSLEEFIQKVQAAESVMGQLKAKKAQGLLSQYDAQIKAIFKAHDTNGDNSIDKKELKAAFKDLKPDAPRPVIARWTTRAFRQYQVESFDLETFKLLCLSGPLSESIK